MAVATAKRILSPGTQVAGYRIEAEIGHGAMAVVYRARQLNLDRPVALKVLSDELAANQEFVSRFFNEARAAAALSHDHIVQAYDAGIAAGGIHFFAMEYVEGETLLQRIRQQGHLRPGPGIEIATDIAGALNYGWKRHGLTHGDIKPENIMLNRAGKGKLADFGLARVTGQDFTGSDILLTPLYAAPERIRGEQGEADCRSDIYAFGATLYHMFGGTPPFPGERAQEVMQRHLTEALEPLHQRHPAVPGRISDLVGLLLQKEPAQRPGDWEAVLAVLRNVRKALTEPPAAKIAVPTTKRVVWRAPHPVRRGVAQPGRRAWGKPRVVGVLLLLAGLVGVIAAQWRPGRRAAQPHEPGAARMLAAPEAAPTTPLPVVESALGEPWERVLQHTLSEGDPERALALLEDFRERCPAAALPAAYAKLRADLRTAVSERQAAPTGRAPVAAITAGEGGGAAEPSVSAALGGAPTGVGAATADDQPTLGGGSARGAGAAVEAVAALAAQSEVPVTRADQRADAMVTYMGALAGLEYRFPLHLDAYMQGAQEWLLNFPEESVEKVVVTFVASTVLPALEEALPKLAANSGTLAGLKLPGREYGNCSVAGVSVKELVLREQTQHGVVSRKVAWERLDSPEVLILYLSQRVAGRGATWAERRPFLALLLLSRNGRLLDEAMRGLPEAPERANWEGLRTTLARATAENKALRLWQRASEARREGERTAAYRLLLELQATRSGVSERHAERLRQLVGELSGGVPEVAGGALLREGAAQVGRDASAALASVLLAWTRYGAADFPEKAGMSALRRRAIAGLPLEGWRLQQVRKHPQHLIVPFAQPSAHGIPALAIRMHQAASEVSRDLVPGQADLLAALEGPCLLEFGDWAGAERLITKVQEGTVAALPAAARAAAWFSRGLTEARFGVTNEKPITEALRQCSREVADKADSEFVLLPQILALEYGLFLRYGEQDLLPYLAGPGALAPRGPSAELRARLLLDLIALSIDRRQTEAIARLAPLVSSSTGAGAEWGLGEAGLALVRLATAPSTNAQALLAALAALDRQGSTEWHLRLIASMALAHDQLDEGVWRQASEWISLRSVAFGPVGGTAAYDVVLARIGQLLAGDDLQGADDTAAWALALTSPCLAPYYARLTFVRWGVARLRGEVGRRELGEQVEAATCASRLEKVLSRCGRGEVQREKAREAGRGNPEAEFWLNWLSTAERLGGAGARASRGGIEPFSSSRLPRAEQLLAQGLVDWAGHSNPAAPVSDRGKVITP